MDFSLIGVTYDGTQTFRKGAARAPKLLREMFPRIETFVNGVDLEEKAFFRDLGDVKDASKMPEMKGIPIILGGEHSITVACAKKLGINNVVIFDAHVDCSPKDSHENVGRRLAEAGFNVYLYGVRVASREELEFLKTGKVKLLKSVDELRAIKGPIYLSVDFDILDQSVLPAVGNPEPDGLLFGQVVEAIAAVAPNVRAMDFVEYTPTGTAMDEVYSALAAKLIYAAIAEIIRNEKKQI